VQPAAVLRYLADLAATTARHGGSGGLPAGITPEMVDLTRTGEPAEWLGTRVEVPVSVGATPPAGSPPIVPASPLPTVRRTGVVRHLAALDALQPTAQLLRLGWVTVAGTVPFAGNERTVCFPLMSQPTRVPGKGFQNGLLAPHGPPELTPLVTDADVAARLEAEVEYGGGALSESFGAEPTAELIARLPRLQAWIRAVVDAAGLPPVRAVLPPSENPLDHRAREGLVAVVGVILYVSRDQFRPSVDASLRHWAGQGDALTGTAFAHLYGATGTDTGRDPGDEHAGAAAAAPGSATPADSTPPDAPEPVCTPLPLSAAQAEAVRRARHEAVAALSGPPGSGKSHTVAAIASDAVTRGGSVLIATRSEHAAAVVAGLLARQAGPDPVLFGMTDRDDLVRQVGERGVDGGEVRRAHAALDEAVPAQALAERAVTRHLDLEASVERAAGWDGLVGELRALAPAAFDPGSDLGALTALADGAGAPATSWWGRWRVRRAARRLRAALGAADAVPLADLRTALRCAADRRDAAELSAGSGTVLAPVWDHLRRADAAVQAAAGRVAEVEAAREDRRRRGRGAARDLATALRAGRRQRRRLLRSLDGRAVVQALPLWVGTLRDVEDLLPDTAGLFDLVILDEASQIDQVLAAAALLRGRRAVVVGDPRQLRHVSFVGDDQVRAGLEAHGLAAAAGTLDVRRASVLDVAAGVTPVTWLDEHYRSVPHLIEFSARRFYDGRLAVATRHPANEATDVIDVVRVRAPAAADGAPAEEVEAALAAVRRLADGGARDIAVVTPFRELADTAQSSVLGSYPLEELERLRLRVGTVHAFQGAEADHVVLALGVAPSAPAGRRRFVEDAHLFNVMVTRARRSLTVVTSLPPRDASPADSLIEQYLTHADHPPAPPRATPAASSWADALARELQAMGLVVRSGYPVGRWTVDLCVGEDDAVAIETAVHPDGPAAHIARHRTLAAAGWRILDGYPSRWDGEPTRAAVELAGEISGPPVATASRTQGLPPT
jgi:hypothetical protein